MFILINLTNGKTVNPGDIIQDFRGYDHIFKGFSRSGRRILTEFDGCDQEYFPQVFSNYGAQKEN